MPLSYCSLKTIGSSHVNAYASSPKTAHAKAAGYLACFGPTLGDIAIDTELGNAFRTKKSNFIKLSVFIYLNISYSLLKGSFQSHQRSMAPDIEQRSIIRVTTANQYPSTWPSQKRIKQFFLTCSCTQCPGSSAKQSPAQWRYPPRF
jgi:hypothetical protein